MGWTQKDTEERLAYIEREGYNGVGEFEVRLMLGEINRLKSQMRHSWREIKGQLVHDGDCHFWGLKVCTCGLLHHLAPMVGDNLRHRRDFYEQQLQQQVALDHLLLNPPVVHV